MRLDRKLLFKSLQFRLIFGFLSITIPIIAFLVYYNFYAMGVVRNQIAQSNENMVTLYMDQIDSRLAGVDNYLYNMAAENLYLLDLELPEEGNNQTYYFSKIQLNQKISADVDRFSAINTLFIYSENNEDLLTAHKVETDYTEGELIQQEILQILSNGEPDKYRTDQWFVRQVNEHHYLCRIVKIGDVYIGALGNVNKLMVPLDLIHLGEQGRALLANERLEPMNNVEFIKKNQINLQYASNVYNLTGVDNEYLVVGAKSNKGNFSLVTVIRDDEILEGLPYLQRVIWLISLGSLFVLPIIYIFLRKIILVPINRIVEAMRKIKEGDLETRIVMEPTSNEFELMNETFNSMASEIQELKIGVYEEKLNNQKAELNHLQLQINPHFFLNSLNIIYHLAQVKKYALIQEMALSLVQYFRFMFRSNLDFVSLKDEVEHTHNYLRIQEMRFPGNLTYEVSVPDSLGAIPVPPLCIQTFVENTIKHGMTMDEQVHIGIFVEADKVISNMLEIVIFDTGNGFPDEVLQQLQGDKSLKNEQGEHIGIWNVQRRLRLLYQEQAKIAFSNRAGGGAMVQICLPFHSED